MIKCYSPGNPKSQKLAALLLDVYALRPIFFRMQLLHVVMHLYPITTDNIACLCEILQQVDKVKIFSSAVTVDNKSFVAGEQHYAGKGQENL